MNVIENGVRPKNGMAAYRIGSYVNGEIVSDIVKYNPINSDYLKKNYDAWIKKIKSLVDEINTIKLSCGTTEISESDDITERLTKPRKKETTRLGKTTITAAPMRTAVPKRTTTLTRAVPKRRESRRLRPLRKRPKRKPPMRAIPRFATPSFPTL